MCERHEHFGIHVIDEIFRINIDEVFKNLFTDCPIFQEFIQIRNTYGISLILGSCNLLPLKSTSNMKTVQ